MRLIIVFMVALAMALFIYFLISYAANANKNVSMETVIDMSRKEIGALPGSCAGDLIYDMAQEIKRLRNNKIN